MKLQITITDEEKELLAQRAALLGYDITKFTKYLLSHEAMKVVETPVVPFDEATESVISRAISEDEGKKTRLWQFGKYGN